MIHCLKTWCLITGLIFIASFSNSAVADPQDANYLRCGEALYWCTTNQCNLSDHQETLGTNQAPLVPAGSPLNRREFFRNRRIHPILYIRSANRWYHCRPEDRSASNPPLQQCVDIGPNQAPVLGARPLIAARLLMNADRVSYLNQNYSCSAERCQNVYARFVRTASRIADATVPANHCYYTVPDFSPHSSASLPDGSSHLPRDAGTSRNTSAH